MDLFIQGNDEKALDYFEKGLKILEIGDKKGIGLSYLNIGLFTKSKAMMKIVKVFINV